MPLRRDFVTGGWKRLTGRQAQAHDDAERSLQQQQQREEEAAAKKNTTSSSSSGLAQWNSRNHQTGGYQDWATEGMRRVRHDQVMRRMQFLTLVAATGGLLFGYDTGVISGAMLPMKRAFDLTPGQEEIIVSSTVLFAFFSSAIGGSLNQHWGRRKCIVFSAAVFVVGSLMLFAAWNFHTLVLGRTVVGVGIGIASLTTPIYIAEVAVPHWRGTLVTANVRLNQSFIH